MRILLIISIIVFPLTAIGGDTELYMGPRQTVKLLYTASSERVAIAVKPDESDLLANTCNWYNFRFTFLANTISGERMLQMLTEAQVNDRPISLWYLPSSMPGTTVESGCNESTMATVVRVGVS